jgi:MoaA/NifB/PqqE/SkfB family radical SAM enzyme
MDKLVDLFEYAAKKGIDGIGLQPFHPIQARAKELVEEFLIPEEKITVLKDLLNTIILRYPAILSNSTFFIRNIPEFYRDHKMPAEACYAGLQEVHIYPDGSVSPCCFIPSVLSLRENSLKKVLASKEFNALLKKARKKECPGCWSPPVHEYNLLFKPVELLSGLKLLTRFIKWSK